MLTRTIYNLLDVKVACARSQSALSSRRLPPIRCNAKVSLQSHINVREAETDDELESCARIRASAYYEVLPSPRYVINLKRQFAREEFQGLVKRTRNLPGIGSPRAVCFVALDEEQCVVGCGDLRPPFCRNGQQPDGVPQDTHAAFLANLAVDAKRRRRGVGSAILRQALLVAQQELQARRVYAHVDESNPAACSMYEQVGFEKSRCAAAGNQPSGIAVLVVELDEDLQG